MGNEATIAKSAKRLEDIAVLLHRADNVAVLKRPVKAGDELIYDSISLKVPQTVPAGHKIALTEIQDSAPVRRYGQIIGFAKGKISLLEHVHTHNVVMRDFGRDYQFCVDARPIAYYPAEQMRSFNGYARPGGAVGTRNYVAVISSVNCSASVSHYIRDRFRTLEFKRDFPNVDGVIAFTHKGGCAIP